MNTLFKAFAALVAAFTLVATPAFATEYSTIAGGHKVYDCKPSPSGGVQVLSDSPFSGKKEWVPMLSEKLHCEDLLLKKPTAKNTEVKALGGKPEIANPKKALVSTEYCNNGVVYYLSITFGNIRDAFIGGACQVDPKKTLVLAGL